MIIKKGKKWEMREQIDYSKGKITLKTTLLSKL